MSPIREARESSGAPVGDRVHARRRAFGARAPAPLIALAMLCSGLAAVPLVYLLVRAAAVGIPAILATLMRPRVLELTLNTLGLAVAVTLSSLVLGVASAWVVTRFRLRATRFLLVISALPLAVPSYLAAYGWLVWFPSLQGFWASLLVMTAVCVPYVTLPVAAVMRSTSNDLESVARTLGRGALSAFFTATWPRVRSAAIAGSLLVCLYTLSDFGLVSMLRFETLTWGINSAYGASFDRNQAALLALVLVALALAVVSGERRSRSRVPSVVSRTTAPPRAAGSWAPFAYGLLFLSPVVGVLIPVAGLVSRLLDAATVRAIDVPRLIGAIVSTVSLAAIGAAVAVLLALPIAALAARYRGKLVAAIESVGLLGQALPGIVVGLSLVFFALAVLPTGLYQTAIMLVFAYTVLFMPKAIGTMRSGLAAVPGSLTDVSRVLGLSARSTWWRVTARLALPSVGIGALLVAISIMKELPATLLLRPTGISTLATELWSRTTVFEFGAAAPYAAALVLLAAVPAVALSGIRGGAKEQM